MLHGTAIGGDKGREAHLLGKALGAFSPKNARAASLRIATRMDFRLATDKLSVPDRLHARRPFHIQ
jgi:hypothetical protein